MLGASVALAASVILLVLEQHPTVFRALISGALTALACGVRPQVFLVLLLPWALVALKLSRKRHLVWLWACVSGFGVSLALWLPVVLLTGPSRYLRASKHLAAWMGAHEYLSRFPARELSGYVTDWLMPPH